MEVKSLFASGDLAGPAAWCSSIAIATLAYIIVQVIFSDFPDYVTCITS